MPLGLNRIGYLKCAHKRARRRAAPDFTLEMQMFGGELPPSGTDQIADIHPLAHVTATESM